MIAPNKENNHLLTEASLFEKYKIISDNHPEYWSSLKNNILNIYEKAQFLSINDVHTSIKLIEMNQGISFLPIYITKIVITIFRLLTRKFYKHLFHLHIYTAKRKIQKYWRLLNHLKVYCQ